MKMRKKHDEDTEKFWGVASSAQEEVNQWPEWKRKIDVYDYVVGKDEVEKESDNVE